MALNYPNKYQILRKFAKKSFVTFQEEKHLKRSFYTQKHFVVLGDALRINYD